MKKYRNSLRLAALLLCLVMVLSVAVVPGAAAGTLQGYWEKISLEDKGSSYNVGAFVLYEPVRNCRSFNLTMDVSMRANTHCTDWQIWLRNGRKFEKASTIYLPGGDGRTSKTVRFSNPVSFDAIAITPTKRGGYSWELDLAISDVQYDTQSAARGNVNYLSGDWEKVSLSNNGNSFTTSGLVLDTPLRNCIGFDLDVDITMHANTSCNNWNVWIRSGGRYEMVSSLYLAAGYGSLSKTIKLPRAKTVEAVALTPSKGGNYSWTMSMGISAPQYDTSALTRSAETRTSTGTYLPGEWESVTLNAGRDTYHIHALALDSRVKNCNSFVLDVDITMKANTKCKFWEIWVRNNGKFYKAGDLYLPNGDGEGSATVYFNSPMTFDAVAITPTADGGYSWSLAMGIRNVR